MPFRAALSGLTASSAELRVLGNNIANSATTGFKKSRAEFADVFASSNLGASSNAIGTGVKISAIAQQFSQGNIDYTDSNLDLAVSGSGFFVMNDNGVTVYTRAGALGVDRTDNIVNSAGQILTGFQPDGVGGVTGAIGDLVLDRSDIPPLATSTLAMGVNIDASATVPSATPTTGFTIPNTTSFEETDTPAAGAARLLGPSGNISVRDNYGVARNLQIQYVWVSADVWQPQLVDTTAGGGGPFNSTTTIDTSGASPSTTLPATLTFNWIPQTATGAQDTVTITATNNSVVDVIGNVAIGAAPTPDSSGSAQAAFDATDAATYNHSTSLTVFDSLGTSHLLTTYFRKANQANEWEMFTFSDGSRVDSAVVGAAGDTLIFSTSGALTTPATPASYAIGPFTPGGGAAAMTVTTTVSGITQFGSAFSVNSLTQNGYTTGRLSDVDIGETGILTARFTNGQSNVLGQVALANFSNEQGLQQLGDSSWSESFASGAALVGAPATGSLGTIQSGALEGSNVDLTEQLVSLITAQRNFQANAKVIETANAVTQTIINLR